MPRINQIQVRRDTAANWTSTNPVLAAGEIGLETNTRKTKFGDGTTAWTSLAYATSGGITSSDTAPSSPSVGDQWFNSSTGKTYVYYDSYWIELDSNGTSAQSTGNAIINGAFEINQRNFTSTTASGFHTFDRWRTTAVDGTSTFSNQLFTLGSAPVEGYEARNFLRIVTTGQTLASAQTRIIQNIESVRSFANQTVTVSFWAKATTGTPFIAVELAQLFGSGGSSPVTGIISQKKQITTNWNRYEFTGLVPSIAGKTIGTDSSDRLDLNIFVSAGSNLDARTGSLGNQNNTFEIWGVQLEEGPVATPFKRNANSLQGELAACQRYFYRATQASQGAGSIEMICHGQAYTTTNAVSIIRLPQEMRATPSLSVSAASDFNTTLANFADSPATALSLSGQSTRRTARLDTTVASGLVAGNITTLFGRNANATLDLSAEL
jgi:hypothetical protein